MTANMKSPTVAPELVTPQADPVEDTRKVFTPSSQLGELLDDLAHEQREVDRRESERLARLREIQTHD